MKQRGLFVSDMASGEDSLSELCRRYGISRPTGYLWWRRYQEQGWEGLRELARAAKRHPNEVESALRERILEVREKHPTWGPRKIKTWLQRQNPEQSIPAASTIGEMLRRAGFSAKRRTRSRVESYPHHLTEAQRPNHVWGVDFKGWFLTQNGQRCDPLTILDNYSRYLVCTRVVPSTRSTPVQSVFEECFQEFGLPDVIRSDNGAPFAGRGAGGISRLSAWWIKLGIRPERIARGRPQQNGRQERMHRTLKQETASPPAANRRDQQRRFDQFRQIYNQDRPHQSLGDRPPAELYLPSPRAFPHRLPQVQYPSATITRRVGRAGEIYWRHEALFLTEVLIGELVALHPLNDRYHRVCFGPVPLVVLDTFKRRLIKTQRRIDRLESKLRLEKGERL